MGVHQEISVNQLQ